MDQRPLQFGEQEVETAWTSVVAGEREDARDLSPQGAVGGGGLTDGLGRGWGKRRIKDNAWLGVGASS